MAEYENIVVLEDADGSEIEFEILDVVQYEGLDYAVLLPVDYEAEPEAVILELLPAEDEEASAGESLSGVDDPAVLDAVFKLFLEQNPEFMAGGQE